MLQRISKKDRIFIVTERSKGVSYAMIAQKINLKNPRSCVNKRQMRTIFERFSRTGSVLYNDEIKKVLSVPKPKKINETNVINSIKENPSISVRKISIVTGT